MAKGLAASPIGEVLVEASIAGWKEFELEVMRDRADNCVIICSIENVDPMGVHTGDSITVAPAQTLSDVEYQRMRNDAFACIRRVGVETGGSNVQFALDPVSGRQVIIEMNPRVSRSSALASKATGYPIAKMAAKLAVGYTLDEIPNDITKATPACFEPVMDYVVTKVPRWAFEKLPGTTGVLGTQMQSVGEAMAIGRTFAESLQKGLRSLEQGRLGSTPTRPRANTRRWATTSCSPQSPCRRRSASSSSESCCAVGSSIDDLYAASGIDPWFLDQMAAIVEERLELTERDGPGALARADWRRVKRLGFADAQLAHLWGTTTAAVRAAREAHGVRPTFKTVDTCAAEFAAETPYHYSTWEDTDEVRPSDRPTVVILGSGPNRIGQGIEFDYCCVHASFALRDAGFRDGDGQLQPGDRLDRLRHVRPAVLRAADGGGRAPRDRRRDGGRRRHGAQRHRLPRRADAAQAGVGDPRRARGGHGCGVDRPGRGPGEVERARVPSCTSRSRRAARRPTWRRRCRSSSRSGSRCSCGRATCSAGGR